MYTNACTCVVCICFLLHIHTYKHTHIYIYTYTDATESHCQRSGGLGGGRVGSRKACMGAQLSEEQSLGRNQPAIDVKPGLPTESCPAGSWAA